MNAIRVKTHLKSDSPYLPQLRPMIGRDVEIIVLEGSSGSKALVKKTAKAQASTTGKGSVTPRTKRAHRTRSVDLERQLDAIALAQGVKPVTDARQLLGGWPADELNDCFEADLQRRRSSEIVTELKDK